MAMVLPGLFVLIGVSLFFELLGDDMSALENCPPFLLFWAGALSGAWLLLFNTEQVKRFVEGQEEDQ
jgi:hypothetical protein